MFFDVENGDSENIHSPKYRNFTYFHGVWKLCRNANFAVSAEFRARQKLYGDCVSTKFPQ